MCSQFIGVGLLASWSTQMLILYNHISYSVTHRKRVFLFTLWICVLYSLDKNPAQRRKSQSARNMYAQSSLNIKDISVKRALLHYYRIVYIF